MRHDPGPAMTRPDDADHVQVVLGDQPVQVGIDEIEARRGAPMAKQAGLDVIDREGPVEKWIVLR